MVPLRATRPLSVASSQTGRRGQEVRHPSSTSAWVRGCRWSHSSRSQTSGVIVSFSLSIIAPNLAPLSRAVPICLASWITAVAIWRTSETCRAGARLSPSDGHNSCGQAYLRNARGAAIRNEALCDAERIGDDGLCLAPQPPACSAPLAEAPPKGAFGGSATTPLLPPGRQPLRTAAASSLCQKGGALDVGLEVIVKDTLPPDIADPIVPLNCSACVVTSSVRRLTFSPAR